MIKAHQSHRKTVAVVGAAGHTGSFVVAELNRRGIDVIAIRRPSTLERMLPRTTDSTVTWRTTTLDTADNDDAGALDVAISGAAAVINCAGPFLDTANPIIKAALRTQIPYLDVTAEQASTAATFATFNDAAKNANVAIVPAMGFYGGFADLLVSATMEDWDQADTVDVLIGLNSWHPTVGTRLTGQRNTAPRVVLTDRLLQSLPLPASNPVHHFPEPLGTQTMVPLPFSEMILFAQNENIDQARTYINESALQDIRDPATPPPQIGRDGHSDQLFMVEVTVRKGANTRSIRAEGWDIYAFSALLLCEAVERLTGVTPAESGVHPPSALFGAEGFLSSLSAFVTTVRH